MRIHLLHACVALSVLIASGLASSPAAAHVALVRGLETAAAGTAVLVPGFGVALATEQGESYRYACDAQLGTTPYNEQQHLVSLQDHGWLLADPGGLHRISASGCAAPAPQGFPRERAVLAVAVAPGAEPTAYVVDDQSRIYRSEDAGATWHVLAELAAALPVTGLAIAGDAPHRIYVSQSSSKQASLAWSSDGGVSFETAPLPGESGLVTLQAVQSGEVDRLWLSASQPTSRDVAIWRMNVGGEAVTVHQVRFFGGLALGDDVVWVGDEAGGLYRSEHDDPFSVLEPDLAVSCLHHDRAGSLWVCTPTTSDQNAVLVSDDLGETLRPQLALQQVQALVECPGAVKDQCASAWNEWQVDVLRLATDLRPWGYPGTVSSPPAATSMAAVPVAMNETPASEPEPLPPAPDGCSLAAGQRSPLSGAFALLLLGVVFRRRSPASKVRRPRHLLAIAEQHEPDRRHPEPSQQRRRIKRHTPPSTPAPAPAAPHSAAVVGACVATHDSKIGATLRALDATGTEYRVKVRGGKKVTEGWFRVEGRFAADGLRRGRLSRHPSAGVSRQSARMHQFHRSTPQKPFAQKELGFRQSAGTLQISRHTPGLPGVQRPEPKLLSKQSELSTMLVLVQPPGLHCVRMQSLVVSWQVSRATVLPLQKVRIVPEQTFPVLSFALPSARHCLRTPPAQVRRAGMQTRAGVGAQAPVVMAVCTQALTQVSVVQASLSLQLSGLPTLQRPPPHVSAPLQALPSEQLRVLFVCAQPDALSQVSVVQTLLSLQLSAPQLNVAAQVPFVHVCPAGQLTGVFEQLPVCGLQLSVVQALLSLQLRGAPVTQPPF